MEQYRSGLFVSERKQVILVSDVPYFFEHHIRAGSDHLRTYRYLAGDHSSDAIIWPPGYSNSNQGLRGVAWRRTDILADRQGSSQIIFVAMAAARIDRRSTGNEAEGWRICWLSSTTHCKSPIGAAFSDAVFTLQQAGQWQAST